MNKQMKSGEIIISPVSNGWMVQNSTETYACNSELELRRVLNLLCFEGKNASHSPYEPKSKKDNAKEVKL